MISVNDLNPYIVALEQSETLQCNILVLMQLLVLTKSLTKLFPRISFNFQKTEFKRHLVWGCEANYSINWLPKNSVPFPSQRRDLLG